MGFKLLLSFLVGGTWVALSTWIAERFGTKIGGFAAGLPSTILVSLFFIGWTHSPQAAAQAAAITPMVGAINSVFLIIYIALVRHSFVLALSVSLMFWSAAATILVLLDFSCFGLSLIFYVSLIPLCYVAIEKIIRIKSQEARSTATPFGVVLARAMFSGSVIAFAVLAAWLSGPLLGGVISMFPAMFLGTLVITYFAHGPLFSSAVMKTALFGSISVVLYGVLVKYTYPEMGLWWGTLICIFVSFSGAFLIHTLIIKRLT
jgi:hypothetical protein